MVTEAFAAMHIRQVNLDKRNSHAGQRIAQRHAGMRVGGRIDDDEVHPFRPRGMDAVNQRPFMVGLERRQRDTGVGGVLRQCGVDIGQRGVPVRLRLARAQQIQVWPMQDQHLAVAGRATDGAGCSHGGSTSSTKLRGDYRSLEGFV